MRLILFFFLLFLTQLLFGQNSEKLDSINDLIQKSTLAENPEALVKLFTTKGKIYFKDKDYVQALPEYLKVDSIAKQYKLVNENTIEAIMDRAEISRGTFTRDGTDTANALLEDALVLAKDIDSKTYIYKIYMRISDVKGLMREYAEAKKYADLAFPYYLKKDDSKSLSWLYAVYKNYYYAVDSLDKAKKVQLEKADYFRQRKDSLQLADALEDLGNFYRKEKADCQTAMPHFKESEAIYKNLEKTKHRDFLYLLENLALCYADLGNHKTAYEYYKEAYALRKVVVRESNNNLTRNLEAKYQGTAKEQEIKLLESKNLLAEQQKVNQRNLFLGGLSLTTVAGLFFFFQYKNRQKTTRKLQELDKAKSDFFTNISHEFRTPLTLISGPIQKQLKKENLSQEEQSRFSMINRNANRLLSLVDQLLDISKIESGNLKLKIHKNDVLVFVSTLADSFTFSAQEKQINYQVDIGKYESDTWFDKDVVEKIVTNLLSNAIKYTPENGKIWCQAHVEKDVLKLTIKNTGEGLDKEAIKKVFERFYQINDHAEGTGIGLALVKELAQLHKGTITAESIPNELTTFMVSLPIEKSNFKEEELLNIESEPTEVYSPSESIENQEEKDKVLGDKNILLIVEDNADVRSYVSSIFAKDYDILQAANGEEGVALALEHIPEIIISDVMMPKKDGVALCNELKHDERTSHIPIILLTAKAGDEHKIKGLKANADDYITKPFSEDLLSLKVKKLIENCKALQERYSQELVLLPKDLAITPVDELFFKRIQEVFETRLIESDFSVDEFGKAIGMSRMQLHRKIKALTGLTTSEFIRSQRLKLAAELLKKSDVNISQIGYSVGFNDHAYFSKSFKDAYGCTPTEYANS